MDANRRSHMRFSWRFNKTPLKEKQLENANYQRRTYNDHNIFTYSRPPLAMTGNKSESSGILNIKDNLKNSESERQKELIFKSFIGSILFGYRILPDRIDKILFDVKTINVRPDIVQGKKCYLLDADTKYGDYKFWIAPDYGYSLIKVESHQKEGDALLSNPNHKPAPSGYRVDYVYETLEIVKINDVWFPKEGITKSKAALPGIAEYQNIDQHIWLRDIDVNPEFSDADFGNEDVLNGAMVYRNAMPVRYQWQDGKVVLNPVDDRTLRNIEKEVTGLIESEQVPTPEQPFTPPITSTEEPDTKLQSPPQSSDFSSLETQEKNSNWMIVGICIVALALIIIFFKLGKKRQ